MSRPFLVLTMSALPLLAPFAVRAQTLDSTMARANSAEAAGDFSRAARLYERAYHLTGLDPSALAAAAVAAARAGQGNLAVNYLGGAVQEGFLDAGFLRRAERDTALATMRLEPRWMAILQDAHRRVRMLDSALRAELLGIAVRDQKNRETINETMTRYGRSSPQGDSAIRALVRNDAPLLARVREIIARHGWPGRSLVADDGAHAAWLVVQHAPDSVQRRLLPVISAAIQAGEGRLGDLALLEDRVLVADKRPQLYGTQMRSPASGGPPTLEPIADEVCVDRRRESVGLEPLADYLRRFGVVYSAPAAGCAAEPASTARAVASRGAVHAAWVNPRRLSLVVGSSMRVQGGVDADAAVTVRSVALRSSNPAVARIDDFGIVTAVSPGTATIIATSVADPTVTGTATVTVRSAPR